VPSRSSPPSFPFSSPPASAFWWVRLGRSVESKVLAPLVADLGHALPHHLDPEPAPRIAPEASAPRRRRRLVAFLLRGARRAGAAALEAPFAHYLPCIAFPMPAISACRWRATPRARGAELRHRLFAHLLDRQLHDRSGDLGGWGQLARAMLRLPSSMRHPRRAGLGVPCRAAALARQHAGAARRPHRAVDAADARRFASARCM